MHPEISEAERFPLLTPLGRRFLHAMRQHSSAPIWNWPNGEQLDEEGLSKVQSFATALRARSLSRPAEIPDWIPGFVDFCLEEVPFYRRRSSAGTRFQSIASCTREDVTHSVWDFVPDSQSLDRLIVFSSSGTTGHPAKIPSHPATAAAGIPLLEYALDDIGLQFPRGADQMALTNLVAYRGAYTTAIVMSYLNEAGCIRVNLCDEDWRSPGDRQEYLNHWQADVMLGDPVALSALACVRLNRSPRVMMSSVMSLSDALAAELTARHGCHVFDLYALTEAGIVAVKTPDGHRILPHDLYVEVLDEHDQPCPPGRRGEVTLTGGRNPFLPLLRYRTGDFGSLTWQAGRPVLVDLDGRQPVMFVTSQGRVVHSMEVTRSLRHLPLVQFRLHQDSEGHFDFGYRGAVDADQLRTALANVLGTSVLGSMASLTIAELENFPPSQRKIHQYLSHYPPPSSGHRTAHGSY